QELGTGVDEGINPIPQEGQKPDRDGAGGEEAHLHWHARAGKSRHDHEAGADPAEGEEGRENNFLRKAGEAGHEMVPRTRISTPLAISTCERTGRVGKSRSTIMRT